MKLLLSVWPVEIYRLWRNYDLHPCVLTVLALIEPESYSFQLHNQQESNNE